MLPDRRSMFSQQRIVPRLYDLSTRLRPMIGTLGKIDSSMAGYAQPLLCEWAVTKSLFYNTSLHFTGLHGFSTAPIIVVSDLSTRAASLGTRIHHPQAVIARSG